MEGKNMEKTFQETAALRNSVLITDPEEKQKIARSILEALQDWFAITESREEYIRSSAEQPFFAAFRDNTPVGFLCLKETGDATVELAVMGVLKNRHRQGIGKDLFSAAKEYAVKQGYEFMQVKTVQMGLYDDYDALTFMDQYQSCTSDIVVCIEGTGAQTLARMRDSHDDRFRFIVGFDMTDALKDNVMDGILTQDTFGMGATIVDELIRYRQTGSYSAQTINTAVEWHTEYVEDKE